LLSDCQHSHLVARFRLSPETQLTLREKPGILPPVGANFRSRDLRERVSVEERHFLSGLSLRAKFGVTLDVEQMAERTVEVAAVSFNV
jgi:hypothetical protein